MQFWLIIAVWFVFSFLILWFIGGACTNPINGSNCLASGALDSLRNVPIVGLFLPFNAWNSLMYFLAPITGFIFAFILIKWWNQYFETTEASSPIFLVLIIIALLAGYYVNLSFYMGEAATLNSRNGVKYSLYFCITESNDSDCYSTVQKVNSEYVAQAQAANANTVPQLIPIAFWAELRKSMFLSFVLGAIAGWIPLFVIWATKFVKEHQENN
ncbi:MAG: hypothetical protein WCW44_05535 [archaeon]|jgi:hypothetical protein